VCGRRAVLTAGLIVLCAPFIAAAMVLTHEIGHTVMAWLLGDGRATFRIYGHGCVGCNLYDSQRLSPGGNVAVNLAGVWGTMLLTIVAVAVLAWRGRPRWVPRWLLAEVIVICFGGDLVWQFVLAVQQLPVPAQEPLGWGWAYTDLDAATSFGSQATGWSHQAVAATGFVAAALYAITLAVAVTWAWRRSARGGLPDPGPGPAPGEQLSAG
jgi:hypothetical protein